ncbi:hypothetical protein pipiens_011776 [Culex pipiens pipiens]|uniref:DUF4780 domain-containing protein n=1 Tax=Culex pipiens pipiens TaxID=38569 RepID=A0ABD1D4Y2_CULPP
MSDGEFSDDDRESMHSADDTGFIGFPEEKLAVPVRSAIVRNPNQQVQQQVPRELQGLFRLREQMRQRIVGVRRNLQKQKQLAVGPLKVMKEMLAAAFKEYNGCHNEVMTWITDDELPAQVAIYQEFEDMYFEVSTTVEELYLENEENFEEELHSKSIEDMDSCSSSILDSEEEEDGINVTIKAASSEMKSDLADQKLAGSERRKMKKMIADGMDVDEAHASVSSSTPKRQRNKVSPNGSTDLKPDPKKVCGTAVVSRSAEMKKAENGGGDSRVKLGIIPAGYPDIELTVEQQEAVKEELLKKVLSQRHEKFKPKFVYCKAKAGHVMLSCQDKNTASWVKTTVPAIVPWENAQLSALEEAEIPRKDVLLAFFYRSKDDENDTILGYLESQNDDLDTSAWRIIHRTVKNDHVGWVFSVDSASMRLLEKWQFVVNYKFGQTLFRKRRPNNGVHPADEDSDGEMEVDPFYEELPSDAKPGEGEMAHSEPGKEAADGLPDEPQGVERTGFRW